LEYSSAGISVTLSLSHLPRKSVNSIPLLAARLSGLNSERAFMSIFSARFLFPLTVSPVLMDLLRRFPVASFHVRIIWK